MKYFANIFKQFQTEGSLMSMEPFGSGHINDTFLAVTAQKDCPDYIFQRFNQHVFKNIPALMNNILLVTDHIKNKLQQMSQADMRRECMTVILNQHGQPYFCDPENHYWVCYLYIEKTQTFDIVENKHQAFEGGRILGRFLNFLSDFPHHLLYETLPNFHNIDFRLQHFLQVLEEDPRQRATLAREEIAFVQQQADAMKHILKLGQAGQIPLRTIHNDTKFNNILFDEAGRAVCVIDLDTVMAGHIHYDFSDALRTIVNTAAEDEKDLTKINMNIHFFKAFSQGFLQEISTSLTSLEIENLAPATPLLPYMIGLRFLTDYLGGDPYFKIKFPEHNLQRARAQFKLTTRIQAEIPKLQEIILTSI